MNISRYGGVPGIGAIAETVERVVWWGREYNLLYVDNLLIDNESVDAGSTPTSELRAGLIMGKHTSSSNLYQWDPDAVDGREEIAGVLLRDISMLDPDGSTEDKYGHVLLAGPMKAADMFIEGTAFTTSGDEHLARRQMVGSGKFIIDDELTGAANFLGGPLKNKQITTTTHTATTADNGTRYTYSNAASVTVTLPTLESGLIYEFLRTANEEFIIASAAGDDIVVGGDLSADSVTFTTAGEQIGCLIHVESIYVGTTKKWLMYILPAPLGVGLDAWTYSIAT